MSDRIRETMLTVPGPEGFRHELVRVTTPWGPFETRPSRTFYLVRVGVDTQGTALRTIFAPTLEKAVAELAEVLQIWAPPPPPLKTPPRNVVTTPADWVRDTPLGGRGLGD